MAAYYRGVMIISAPIALPLSEAMRPWTLSGLRTGVSPIDTP